MELDFVAAWRAQLAGDVTTAETVYRALLVDAPDEPELLRQYGILLAEQKRYPEAEALLLRCLAYEPNDTSALCCYGGLLQQTGRLQESIPVLQRCLELAPELPAANWNLFTPLLLLGHWPEGFAAYRYGRLCGIRPQRFLEAEWDGWSDLEGKTIYLWAEQGFGDTIMALQLVHLLRDRCGCPLGAAKIILEVQRDLVGLVKRCFPDCQVFAQPDDRRRLAEFDVHCSLMSLPFALRLTPDDLPGALNYISGAAMADPDSKKTRVGVCWRGSPAHHNDANRSLIPQELLALFDLLPVDLYNLTYGAESPWPVYLDECPGHWEATADLIEALDLVVTVDTAIAHLAGAMGKPTWVLLPALPDWRWGLSGDGPAWYPSVRLFRQERAGDWSAPMQQLRLALNDFLG